MKKIIITGFGLFGEYATNPSGRIARSLDGTHIDENIALIGAELSCTYRRSSTELIALMEEHNPIAVISLDVYLKARGITAVLYIPNEITCQHRDADGQYMNQEKINVNGPDQVELPCDAKKILESVPDTILSTGGTESFGHALAYQIACLRNTNQRQMQQVLLQIPFTDIDTEIIANRLVKKLPEADIKSAIIAIARSLIIE